MKRKWPDWINAPLPRRLHRCRAITTYVGKYIKLDRCRCGALRIIDGDVKGVWSQKNTRVDSEKTKRVVGNTISI